MKIAKIKCPHCGAKITVKDISHVDIIDKMDKHFDKMTEHFDKMSERFKRWFK